MIRFLLMLYPKTWRREYGKELAGVLSAGRLTTGVVADVVCGGVYQRLRQTPAWTVIGFGLLCVSLAHGVVQNSGWWHGAYNVYDDLSLDKVNLVIDFLLVVTGGWLAVRRHGSFLAGLLGAMGAYLIGKLPLLIIALTPGARFPNDDGPVVFATTFGAFAWVFGHMLLTNAFLGGSGAMCGRLVVRVRKSDA